ncbi:MAG: metal-dependent transcriptional regulator [Candidatus Hydrogenedentes bacterium]|nr:metal-dependent transcriptional regulator [Candidatus Hydrogenedentota bacterium]
MTKESNDASHWRDFENNPLSHSMAHYLMAIDSLRNEFGYARSTDVADMLGVSRGAASMALTQLKKRGWVGEDHNRFLLLTEEGVRIASMVEHNFIILSKFFEEVLGVRQDIAAGDACKMEHLMSNETGKRLLWLMQDLLSDEELAVRVRERMKEYGKGCNIANVDECPICHGAGECLVTAEAPDTH